MLTESNNEESSNNGHGCAACKHQRKRCGRDCLLQPYFGVNRSQDFQAAHKVFGISNMTKMMKELRLQERPRAIESLVWEASIWQQDPVNGPLGLYKQLEQENALLKDKVNQLKGLINNNDSAINVGDINIVNFYTEMRNLPNVATNSLFLGQDMNSSFRPSGSQVGISFNGAIISHDEEQEMFNQRGNFHGSRPSFGVVAEPVNWVRGRDYCFPSYFHNNLNWPHLQPMPNRTQQLQAVNNNFIQGQFSYANMELMEDQSL